MSLEDSFVKTTILKRTSLNTTYRGTFSQRHATRNTLVMLAHAKAVL